MHGKFQLARLVDALRTAGPVEVDRLLTAFEQSTDESLGLKLVKALAESSHLAGLKSVSLNENQITEVGRDALVQRFGEPGCSWYPGPAPPPLQKNPCGPHPT